MAIVTSDILFAAARFEQVLQLEPKLDYEFRHLDLDTLAGLIAALIGRGTDTAESISDYLSDHRCAYSSRDVRFLLDQYEGRDRRRCLWQLGEEGRYTVQ